MTISEDTINLREKIRDAKLEAQGLQIKDVDVFEISERQHNTEKIKEQIVQLCLLLIIIISAFLCGVLV